MVVGKRKNVVYCIIYARIDDFLYLPPRSSECNCGSRLVDDRFDLSSLLHDLHAEHDIATILVEAGTGLMSSLVSAGCVDELAIFTAPRAMGDPEGYPPLEPDVAEKVATALKTSNTSSYRREQDELVLCRPEA